MKYLYLREPTNEYKGTLYLLEGADKTKVKQVNLKTEKSPEIKVSIICQLVAEGGNLKDILLNKYLYREVEFFQLLKENPSWNIWYSQAQNIRNKMIVEETFKKLSDTDLSNSDVEGVTKMLKVLSDNIKKNEDNSGLKAVSYVQVYNSKALNKRGWDNY